VAAAAPDRSPRSTQPTIFDRLQQAGISWKFYIQNYDAVGDSPRERAELATRVPLLNYPRFTRDPALRSRIVDLDEYYQDLERGTLPAVAYVSSSGAAERTAQSMPAGQRLVSTMVTALQLSRYWTSSALLWSYDGGGGWYDHVPPPRIGGRPAGLRVPALLVSAYAKRGQVNHTQLDYTSALAFIEANWGLRPLTSRDAGATSLVSAFDFDAPARPRELGVSSSQASPPTHRTLIYTAYGGAVALALVLVAAAVRRRGWSGTESHRP
jgi:phospholipase C